MWLWHVYFSLFAVTDEQIAQKADSGPRALLEGQVEELREAVRLGAQNALQLDRHRPRYIHDSLARYRRQRFLQTVCRDRLQRLARHGVALGGKLHCRFEQSGLVFVARIDGALRHTNMDGDLLHRGLFEAFLQEDVECGVEQFLMALLLLGSCRPAHAGAFDLQIGRITNFLALQPKVLIMERAGTIIATT